MIRLVNLPDGTKTVYLDDKNIGSIVYDDTPTFVTERRDKHVFRKHNSLGINHELLIARKDAPFDNIRIALRLKGHGLRYLSTSRNYFLAKGNRMKFDGYELQVFLPIKLFGFEKVNEWLDHGQQDNLFNSE